MLESSLDHQKPEIDRRASIMTTSALLPQKIRQKIVDKPAWYKSDDEYGWMTIDLSSPPNFLGFAQLCPNPSERLTAQERDNQLAYLSRLYSKINDATIDIFDIICANWIENKNAAGFARILANDILDSRGVSKLSDGTYHTKLKKDVADHISILSNLWVNISKAPMYEMMDGRRQKVINRLHGRLIIVGSYHGKEGEKKEVTPYSWTIMPGEVIQPFFLDPNKQFMLMTKRVLSYHPLKQIIEKRIARHLIWQFRLRQAKGDYLRPFNNERLLTAASIKIDRRNPLRSRDRLEEAFDCLERDNIISGWQYASEWNENSHSKKGWINDWLNLNIIFEPPKEILDFNSGIARESFLLHESIDDRKTSLIDHLKRIQSKNCFSQLQLAEKLEITPAYLSMLLHGTRKPSKKILLKLAKLEVG